MRIQHYCSSELQRVNKVQYKNCVEFVPAMRIMESVKTGNAVSQTL